MTCEPKPLALSVKIILKDSHGRCLLLKRSMDSKNNPGKWDFPGGKIDRGESFDDALAREVREETGLSVAFERLVAATESESPANRIIYIVLEGRVVSGHLRLSDEHQDYLWVHPQDLPNVDLCPQFKSMAETVGRGRNLKLDVDVRNLM